MTPLLSLIEIGPVQLFILAVIGVLFFGKRLPEIGRSLGKSIVEFKKGLKGLEDEIGGTMSAPHHETPPTIEPPRLPQRVPTSAPKFEDKIDNITTTPQQS